MSAPINQQVFITPDEAAAIRWALYRLKTCYQDSQKALAQRPPKLELTAQSNVGNYEHLQGLAARLYDPGFAGYNQVKV